MGSPSSITMLGFGNGTFPGSPSLIVTLGFGSGSAPPVEEGLPLCAHVSVAAVMAEVSVSAVSARVSVWEC